MKLRRISLLILVVLMSTNVFASKIGVGLSTTWSDVAFFPLVAPMWIGAAIHVPIDVDEIFRIEPFFKYGSDFTKETDPDDPEWSSSRELLNYEFGLSLFMKSSVSENSKFGLYYGARFGYVNAAYNYISEDSDGMGNWDKDESTTELSGFSITPTLGFEYYFIENCSLGGEVGWNYTKVSGEYKYKYTDTGVVLWEDAEEMEETITGIINRINLRFYF